jgi:phospholipid-binding lipoprotein MlaA
MTILRGKEAVGPSSNEMRDSFMTTVRPSAAVKFAGAIIAGLLIAACATPPTDSEARKAFDEANDPIEPANRTMFDVNQAFDKGFLKPAAKAYRDVVPDDTRAGVRRTLLNLRSPVIFANDVLQGEMGRAMETVMRVAVNTILGFGGFFDVAGQYGLQRHDEDFGQTLAVWGFYEGPYVMLPVFGPSNVRDTTGLVVDSFMDPLGYFLPFWGQAGRTGMEGIDKRAEVIEPLDEIERTSVDFYATIRSLYRQRRADEINNGQPGMNIPAPSISDELLDAPAAPTAVVPTAPAPAKPEPKASAPATGQPSS